MERIEKCPYVPGKPVDAYMRHEHEELHELLAGVVSATERESKRKQREPGDAKVRLQQFAIDLEQHLLSEERDIFPEARKLGPKWVKAVERWTAAHGPLRETLKELQARHPRPCLLALARMGELLTEHSEDENTFDWSAVQVSGGDRMERMRVGGAPAGAGKRGTYEDVVETRAWSRRHDGWLPTMLAARDYLREKGHVIGDDIGQGFFGMVFTTPSGVVKVTTDPSDAAAAETVRRAGGLPGVMRVSEVVTIPAQKVEGGWGPPLGEGHRLFAIFGERLHPIPREESSYIDHVIEGPGWADRSMRERAERVRDGRPKTSLLSAVAPRPEIGAKLLTLVDTLEALARLGVVVHDVRYDNVMQDSDGNWKIVDLGVSEAPEVEIMERMAARQPKTLDAFRTWLTGPTAPLNSPFVLRVLERPEGLIAFRSVAAAAKPPARRGRREVEDAGAVLPGARKHMWNPGAQISPDDIDTIEEQPAGTIQKYVTKEHVLGPFPWEAEHENGVEPAVAVLKSTIWRAVAARPGDHAEARELYIRGGAWLREGLAPVKTKLQLGVFLLRWYAAVEHKDDLTDPMTGPQLLEKLGITAPYKSLGPSWGGVIRVDVIPPEVKATVQGAKLAGAPYDALNAMTDPYKVEISIADLKARGFEMVYPLMGTYLLAYRRAEYAEGRRNPLGYLFGLAGFDTRTRLREIQKQALVKLVVNSRYGGGGLGGFTDTVRASAAKATWETLLAESGGGRKPALQWKRAVTDQKRVGPTVDVPNTLLTDELVRNFEFRGDQFGEWVNDKDRQEHRRLAWLAFADLARITGLPERAMGNCGLLGIAFGARGKGKAGAHYEAINQVSLDYFPVINLTHSRGDGALAHEWGHFLDHHLASEPSRVMRGEGVVFCPFASGGRETRTVPGCNRTVSEAFAEVLRAMRMVPVEELAERKAAYLRTRDEVNSRLRALNLRQRSSKRQDQQAYLDEFQATEAEFKSLPDPAYTEYYASALALGDYWTRPTELFARAFEAFVEDELTARGEVNTYLVYGTQIQYRAERKGRIVEPYPQGEERKRINAAMRKLMVAVRETEALCGGGAAAAVRS